MKQKKLDNLLTRVDERQKKLLEEIKEHNQKIDDLIINITKLQTQMMNHVNMHKRDLALIGIGLAGLTIFINLLFKFMGV